MQKKKMYFIDTVAMNIMNIVNFPATSDLDLQNALNKSTEIDGMTWATSETSGL